MTNLSDLIERVEAADGPNYALEVEIFKALHPEYAGYVQGRGGLVHPFDGSDVRVLSDVRPPNYTASFGAAMSLIPRGWAIEIRRYFNGDGEYVAAVTLTDSFTVGRGFEPDEKVSVSAQIVERRQGIDPTPQAIVLASLRALQEKDIDHG